MKVSSTSGKSVASVRIQGRFDFAGHREFRAAIKSLLAETAVREIEVDLSAVEYMDSAALGMLLLARENAGDVGKTVTIARPSEKVRNVLDVANFHKLFQFR